MGFAFAPEHGGQGLPLSLATAVVEMWNSASMSWALCPLLNFGAIELLQAHGSPEQQRLYLAKLVSGEWTGTMNLTEPQAGSDLGALRARAVPARDERWGEHYRISGQKILITYGDHDLTDNIVHMVLARTPDAPPGSRGISLFIVPKFLPDAAGMPGERNDLRALRLEEKLGIHASPTCVMSYGDGEGAVGWRVGEENRGLECMFTMMNSERLLVGVQGVAIAERAYQQARDYARTRVQGQPLGVPRDAGPLPIIHHPDVRRMLLLMRAGVEAMRASLPELAGEAGWEPLHRGLAEGLDALEHATAWLVAAEPAIAAAGSAPYLALFGTVAGGWLMARLALAARRHAADGFAAAKLATARCYAEHYLARAPGYLPAIMGGATVLGFDPELL